MGKRGPRPMPTHLKLLRGNPRKEGLNHDEPQPAMPTAVPPAPVFLKGYAAEEWARIAEELYYLRLLTRIDIHALSAYCQAYAIWRTAVETFAVMAERDPVMHGLMVKAANGTALQNPVVLTIRHAANDMVKYAAEFGLTPAARSRISATDSEPPPRSKFGPLLVG